MSRIDQNCSHVQTGDADVAKVVMVANPDNAEPWHLYLAACKPCALEQLRKKLLKCNHHMAVVQDGFARRRIARLREEILEVESDGETAVCDRCGRGVWLVEMSGASRAGKRYCPGCFPQQWSEFPEEFAF